MTSSRREPVREISQGLRDSLRGLGQFHEAPLARRSASGSTCGQRSAAQTRDEPQSSDRPPHGTPTGPARADAPLVPRPARGRFLLRTRSRREFTKLQVREIEAPIGSEREPGRGALRRRAKAPYRCGKSWPPRETLHFRGAVNAAAIDEKHQQIASSRRSAWRPSPRPAPPNREMDEAVAAIIGRALEDEPTLSRCAPLALSLTIAIDPRHRRTPNDSPGSRSASSGRGYSLPPRRNRRPRRSGSSRP